MNGTRPRGTGSLKLVNGIWFARYSSNGKRHHESTKTGDRATAEQWLRRRLKDADRPEFTTPDAKRIRFEALMALVEADHARKACRSPIAHAVKHLAEHFAGWPALRITTLDVEKYATERQQTATVATVNREVAVLRRAFKLAVQKNVLPSMPTFTLGSEKGRERSGFLDDLDTLLTALRARDAAVADLTEFAFLSLLRRGNVVGLTWQRFQLDVDAGHVVAGTLRLPGTETKNGKPLTLPLSGRLLAVVDRRWQARVASCAFLFHRDGHPVREYRKTWAAAATAIGRPGLLFHDLRRSGARAYRRLGIDQLTIQRLGGWRTSSMFERYSIVDESDLTDALSKLDAALATPAPAKVVPIRRPA